MWFIYLFVFAFGCFVKGFGDAMEILFSRLTLNMVDVIHDCFGFNVTLLRFWLF